MTGDGQPLGDHRRGVGLARAHEPVPGEHGAGDPIDAEGPPGVAVEVAGNEVPAPPGVDEAVRLHPALRRVALAIEVGEVEAFEPAAPLGEGHAGGRGRRTRARRPEYVGGLVQRPHPLAKADRQHLLELGEGGDGRVVETGDATAGSDPQPDGDGDCFVVVEQQRRQGATGAELVAAVRARLGVDRVTEVAEPGDVATHGPAVDPEPLGQLAGVPPRPRTGGRTAAPGDARPLTRWPKIPSL